MIVPTFFVIFSLTISGSIVSARPSPSVFSGRRLFTAGPLLDYDTLMTEDNEAEIIETMETLLEAQGASLIKVSQCSKRKVWGILMKCIFSLFFNL